MNYIGFYWTLPVPWAGFTTLPRKVAEAAGKSQSIRYQMERVRHWVKDHKGVLIHEEAFMELRADRGTSDIQPEVKRLLAMAEIRDAELVVVNFAETFFWRPHGHLWATLADQARVMALDPAPMMLDGQLFTPSDHFRTWVHRAEAHAAEKLAVKAALGQRIRAMKDKGLSYTLIANALNDEKVTTPNGKPWRADNLRKFLADL